LNSITRSKKLQVLKLRNPGDQLLKKEQIMRANSSFSKTLHRVSNQMGVRVSNEKLVLSLVRLHGSLSKAEITRMTGLSAQTVSVIMRELERELLLVRGEPIRGKVGQPSVPMLLNADGVYFLGLKIGRRSCELVMTNFLGAIVSFQRTTYSFPLPSDVEEFTKTAIAKAISPLEDKTDRIAGLGIAIPNQLWNWADEVGVKAAEMDIWREYDIRESISRHYNWPVYIQNDATAACGAELVFGRHKHLLDFAYFFIGTFAGGGIVLNGSVFAGRTGNAAALGSMPVPGANGSTVQLIDQASLFVLERELVAQGKDPSQLWLSNGEWADLEAEAKAWLQIAARGLAHATIAAATIIDFQVVLIDGSFPPGIRTKLVEMIRLEFSHLDLQGIVPPEIEEGSIGPVARALGGASLPLFDRYYFDQTMLNYESE
jgi:predicted NBD/HSP70 family sugar kinase